MRTLLIMRHAKSSWDNPDLADFERSLNSRGLVDAPFMGNTIYENEFRPQLIVSSPAKRAKQTAILVKETAQVEKPVEYRDKIYEASPTTLLYIVSELPPEDSTVLLVGHNPGLENLLRLLTGEIHSMPTAAVAKIELDIEQWTQAKPNCGRLKLLMRPKELMKRVDI